MVDANGNGSVTQSEFLSAARECLEAEKAASAHANELHDCLNAVARFLRTNQVWIANQCFPSVFCWTAVPGLHCRVVILTPSVLHVWLPCQWEGWLRLHDSSSPSIWPAALFFYGPDQFKHPCCLFA